MRHETPSRMTQSEEYEFYAIAERSYKESAQKTTRVIGRGKKKNPGAKETPGFLKLLKF
jgi:hypothetical protein